MDIINLNGVEYVKKDKLEVLEKEKLEAEKQLQLIKDAIIDAFGENITVYPCIGNHEVYPNDLWKSGNVAIFEELGKIYKDYLDTLADF